MGFFLVFLNVYYYTSMFRFIRLLSLALILSAALVVGPTSAALSANNEQIGPTPKYLKIFYYMEGQNGRASLMSHLDAIDVLAPQVYYFNNQGVLKGGIKPDIIKLAADSRIKLMPLVTNYNFGQTSLRTLLDDPNKQNAAIDMLVTEGVKQKFWGWQFDFEGMKSYDREKYSAFFVKAAQALQRNNLVASVAVIAQTSNDPADYPKNLWERVVGAYDYKVLGAAADFVSIMSYDDPGSKGPVARYNWLKEVIDYSLKYIPNEKLSLGIPFYYWRWNNKTGKLVAIGGHKTLTENINKYSAKVSYSFEYQAAFASYVYKKVPYTMWFENSQSIAKKIELVTENNLHGFSAWALGLESPDIYSSLD